MLLLCFRTFRQLQKSCMSYEKFGKIELHYNVSGKD